MQIPESSPGAGLALADSDGLAVTRTDATSLCLHPGEPTRTSLQVQNWEAYPQRLSFSLEGNFPNSWYRIGTEVPMRLEPNSGSSRSTAFFQQWQDLGTEGVEVPAKGSWYGEVLFRVPEQFFEDQEALHPDRIPRLDLDFRGCLSVYGHRADQEHVSTQLLQQIDFSLYVRPHSYYVTFLPVLYREVDFISRFVKIFEQAFDPVVNSFANMWANLDPLTSPRALLPFLAHWVGWNFEPYWDLKQQRRLVRRAVEIYRWRGTRRGLRLFLHLYTGLPLDEHLPNEADKHISITEPFGRGFILGDSLLGEDTVLGGGQAFHFVVRLRPDHPQRAIDEGLVRQIIDQEKPAFCTYELAIERP
jgi:phage tail-like protein